MASALAMDKWRSKMIWLQAGLPTPRYRVIDAASDWKGVAADLGMPLIVKPAHEGSSIGITRVKTAGELPQAHAEAARHDELVLAEECITGIEVTASILGDIALPLVRIDAPEGKYDYQNKYFSDQTQYHCPSGLPERREKEIQAISLEAFRMLGCRGWGRADLMIDADGRPWLLEMNTSPGMTGHSLVPMAARQAGMSFEDLVLRILELSTLDSRGSVHVG
jgi:D-alanine-D-alanine ligase